MEKGYAYNEYILVVAFRETIVLKDKIYAALFDDFTCSLYRLWSIVILFYFLLLRSQTLLLMKLLTIGHKVPVCY